MAVYGYTRVSTEGQEDKTSLDEQTDRIAALAKARGWSLTSTFREVASGTTFDRPEFQKMLTLLAPGDSVVVLALSRFSRSIVDGYSTLLEWEKRGIALLSATETIDTSTAMGRHMLRIVLEFATAEREVLLERIEAGRKRNAAAGGFNGGPIALGYRAAPKGAKAPFIVDEEQREIVRKLFLLYGTGRFSLAEVRHRAGCRLSLAGVEGVLANPVYLGRLRYGGATRKAAHEPIVSQRLFRRVQQVRRGRARRGVAVVAEVAELSGKAVGG